MRISLLGIIGIIFSVYSAPVFAETEAQLIAKAKEEGVLQLSSNKLVYSEILLDAFSKKYPFLKMRHGQFDASLVALSHPPNRAPIPGGGEMFDHIRIRFADGAFGLHAGPFENGTVAVFPPASYPARGLSVIRHSHNPYLITRNPRLGHDTP